MLCRIFLIFFLVNSFNFGYDILTITFLSLQQCSPVSRGCIVVVSTFVSPWRTELRKGLYPFHGEQEASGGTWFFAYHRVQFRGDVLSSTLVLYKLKCVCSIERGCLLCEGTAYSAWRSRGKKTTATWCCRFFLPDWFVQKGSNWNWFIALQKFLRYYFFPLLDSKVERGWRFTFCILSERKECSPVLGVNALVDWLLFFHPGWQFLVLLFMMLISYSGEGAGSFV